MKQLLILTGLILVWPAAPKEYLWKRPKRPDRRKLPDYAFHCASHDHPSRRNGAPHWDAKNTAGVTLEQAVEPRADIRAAFESLGTFPSSGTLEVHPKAGTTYVVTCGNELIGCSSASVHIIVK